LLHLVGDLFESKDSVFKCNSHGLINTEDEAETIP